MGPTAATDEVRGRGGSHLMAYVRQGDVYDRANGHMRKANGPVYDKANGHLRKANGHTRRADGPVYDRAKGHLVRPMGICEGPMGQFTTGPMGQEMIVGRGSGQGVYAATDRT